MVNLCGCLRPLQPSWTSKIPCWLRWPGITASGGLPGERWWHPPGAISWLMARPSPYHGGMMARGGGGGGGCGKMNPASASKRQ